MLPTPLILGLSLAGFGIAAPSYPQSIKARQASGAQNVVYWGGTNNENDNLSTYCKPNAGIDILVLSFLDIYGTTGNIPYGNIGNSCYIGATGVPQQCDDLAASIATCQAAGIKIILSLGGAAGSYSLQSQSQAVAIGQYLWEAYGNSGSTAVQRPFGNVFVNGFDFDLELNAGSQYYQYLISTLRSNFLSDSTNTYYITGAPQCPIPEPNMGEIISTSVFDYLWIQFYNNNGYGPDPCSLGLPGDAPFNFNNWTSFIATTPSKNAKLFIGVPANTLAATGNAGGAVYYATPAQLASIVQNTRSSPSFGGIMMWDAGYSDANVSNGCTYAQEAKNILLTGSPCGGSQPVSSSLPTTAAKPTKSATSTSSATGSGPTGTVPQWGQCGGEGYTGPTQCIPPFKCVESSQWWSSCQ
ncbi:carbohydrate-binding module family 1 protein [Trichoderma sp. SZMC 28013]